MWVDPWSQDSSSEKRLPSRVQGKESRPSSSSYLHRFKLVGDRGSGPIRVYEGVKPQVEHTHSNINHCVALDHGTLCIDAVASQQDRSSC